MVNELEVGVKESSFKNIIQIRKHTSKYKVNPTNPLVTLLCSSFQLQSILASITVAHCFGNMSHGLTLFGFEYLEYFLEYFSR